MKHIYWLQWSALRGPFPQRKTYPLDNTPRGWTAKPPAARPPLMQQDKLFEDLLVIEAQRQIPVSMPGVKAFQWKRSDGCPGLGLNLTVTATSPFSLWHIRAEQLVLLSSCLVWAERFPKTIWTHYCCRFRGINVDLFCPLVMKVEVLTTPRWHLIDSSVTKRPC